MRFHLGILIVLQCVFSVSAFAADIAAITQQFRASFRDDTIYTDGRCGPNVTRFIDILKNKRINIRGLQIVEIKDRGLSSLEGAHPYLARGRGSLQRNGPCAERGTRAPGEAEWFHHVILTADGMVFDFDYTNNPTVVTLNEYFITMFLPPEARGDVERISRSLGNYGAEFFDVDLARPNFQGAKVSSGKLKELFPSWFTPEQLCRNNLL
ncbi:MAG: hypothetical protein JNL01_02045 [Bdellovibrionales bacterium]|nr:hypothetical protein [Bdellovibrionales bacterium]